MRKSLLAASISSAISCGASGQQGVEEITVTGSRVRITQGMAEATPVTVVTQDELESFNAGATTVEQLAQLPQFFNTFSSQRGSGTLFAEAGGSYLNLRNLGRERTLILLDGSRVPPADKRGYVNVDLLPTALMRSVDVVTGGASAAYGADALGGVVNYRLDREFQGLNVNVGMGRTDWGDGDRRSIDIAGGTEIGDRVNIIGSFSTTELDEINRLAQEVMNETDWYKNTGHVTNPDWSAWRAANPTAPASAAPVPRQLTLPCVSPTDRSPAGMLWSRVNDSFATNAPLTSFAYNGQVFTADGQGVRPFVRAPYYAAPGANGSTTTMGGDCNNPEFREYMQSRNAVSGREVTSRSGFFGAQYRFTDQLTGFVQALAGTSESRFHNNLGGMVFTGGWHGKVFRENAYLPPQIAQAMDAAGVNVFQIWKSEAPANERNLDFGYEEFGEFSTTAWSAGVDYDFANGWALRASWQTGHSDRETGIVDEQRVDRTYMALDAVVDPANGSIICNVNRFNPTPAQLAASPSVQGRLASPGGVPGGTAGAETTAPLASPVGLDGSIENCTPLNIMGLATNTVEAKNYINTPKFGDGNVDQDFAEVLLTGDFSDGRRYGPIGFAAGLTYREQAFDDQALPTDIDVLGPPLNAPEFGIRGIPPGYTAGSANLHARSTVPNVRGEYDVWEWFGEVNVPVWASPSGERGLGVSLGVRQSDYSNLNDTLDSWKLGLELQATEDLRLRFTRSGDIREATFAERFDTQSTGVNLVDPFLNGARYATTTTSGGNPDLAPERATTEVAGIVYQPRWAPGLSLSADWYDVQVRDAIGQLGAQRIVDECFAGNQILCGQLRTDAGQISRIFNVFLNVAQARVTGVDYEIAYNFEPDFFGEKAESLSIRALAGHVNERSDTPFGATRPTHLEGFRFNPELQGILTTNYRAGPWSGQLTYRHIDAVVLNRVWTEGIDVDNNKIASAHYTSARVAYTKELNDGRNLRVSLDVTNLFDDGPPVVSGADQAVDAEYDIYGRRFFVGLRMDF